MVKGFSLAKGTCERRSDGKMCFRRE